MSEAQRQHSVRGLLTKPISILAYFARRYYDLKPFPGLDCRDLEKKHLVLRAVQINIDQQY